jgi:DNA-binding HxlR family transcriptional regulator
MSSIHGGRFEEAMRLLGKRWNGYVIYRLLDGPMRFGDIKAGSRISARLLSVRLKELEREGIVRRIADAEHASRNRYALTSKGQAMAQIFRSIAAWSHQWC